MRFFEWSATEEEPVTADLLALMCREDSERVTRIIKQAGTARGRFLAEFRSPDSDDGGTVWYMVRGQAFQQEAGVGINGMQVSIENPAGSWRYKIDEKRLEHVIDELKKDAKIEVMDAGKPAGSDAGKPAAGEEKK